MTTSYELHLTEKEAGLTLYAIGLEIYQNRIHGHLDSTQAAALDRVETKLKKLFEAKEGTDA